MSPAEVWEQLREHLLDAEKFVLVSAKLGPAAMTLRKVALAASPGEWERYASSGFDPALLPPLVLGRKDMEHLRGGGLRALTAAEIAALCS